ncbi:MAG: FtsX-like permease family protein [Bacteroidales bacterium]|nr:FtsX-like permease family protein [Bacteroidales bacterium]
MSSYLKFLSRNKLYTAIEAVGLAVSLAFVIIIGSYILQQTSVARENPLRKEIYSFGLQDYYGLTKGFTDVLRERVPEVETATSFIKEEAVAVTFEDGTSLQTSLFGTDTDFFKVFPNYSMVSGNLEALSSTSMCLVTESFAAAHSLSQGSILKINGIDSDVTVGGIVRDFKRTFIKNCDILLSVRSQKFDHYSLFDQYGANVTFAKVRTGTDRQALYDKVIAICKDIYPGYGTGFFEKVSMTRLDEMFFNKEMAIDGRFSRGDAGTLRLLVIVALLLLASAVLNYINLTLALGGKRAKEMATRELHGATNGQIRLKYLGESILFTTICFLFALLIAVAMTPVFNTFINDPDIPVKISLTPAYISLFLILDIAIGLMAGLLPAAVAGRYKPIDIVRGTLRRNSKMRLSKLFIVVQNVLAVLMIALALVMEVQYRRTLNRPINCDISDCYQLNVYSSQDKAVLLEKLKNLPCVLEAGFGGGPGINPGGQYATDMEGNFVLYRFFRMDTTVFRFLGIDVVKDFGTQVLDCVYFGEKAFAAAGYSEDNHDIGDLSRRTSGALDMAGIVKDIPWDNTNLKSSEIGSDGNIVISILNPATFPLRWAPILLKTTGNHKEAAEAIMKTVKEWDCGETLSINVNSYLEDNFKAGLAPTRNNMRLMELFTLLAVLISLLGLVAMSTYFSDIRSKDIAIRKVFGGTVETETIKTIKEYLILVGVACVIGIPLAIWAARSYLERFTWKIDNYGWIFVLAVLITFAVALLSIIWQTLRAARTNPAEALKKE